VYSGLADVAATSPHWALTRFLLSTAMERAVKRHAAGIAVPESLDLEERVRAGAVAYDAMCASCHGAPGAEPDVVGKGLSPEPPDLAAEADEWSAAEVFWITEHGIRMTGMPAFGPTHSDEEIWELVALVKRLPRLSPAEYRALLAPRPGNDQGHRHSHGHEVPGS
jgi:mono/diheme cytochrome c family protein